MGIRAADSGLMTFHDRALQGTSIADGVLFEILYARELGKEVRLFTVANRAREIRPATFSDLTFEREVHRLGLSLGELRSLVAGHWEPEEANPRLFDPDAQRLEETA
jgi:hypothetical protein